MGNPHGPLVSGYKYCSDCACGGAKTQRRCSLMMFGCQPQVLAATALLAESASCTLPPLTNRV